MGKLGGSRTGFWEELPEEQLCTRCFPTPWTLQSISVVRDRDWTSEEEDRQPWKPVPRWLLLRLSGDRGHNALKIWCPTTLGKGFALPRATQLHFSWAEPNWAGACPGTNQSDLLFLSFPQRAPEAENWCAFSNSQCTLQSPSSFPRLQRWTAWWDQRYRFGGCGMF